MKTQPARKLREAFLPGDAVSIDDAARIVGENPKKVSASLTHLAEQRAFIKVRRRLWVRAGAPVDPYKLGARVTSPYVFAYGTALALHGAAASERSEILVSSLSRFDTFEFEGVLYRHVRPWKDEGRVRVSVGPEFVWASSAERTLVECARVPSNAGGVADLLRSITGLPELDPDEVLLWLDHYGDAAAAARVGYLLQVTDRPEREFPLLSALEQRRPRSRVYFDPSKRSGKLVARWNLLVPPQLLENLKVGANALEERQVRA